MMPGVADNRQIQVNQEAAVVAPRYPLPAGLEKLTGLENWQYWKFLVKLHLEQYRLDGCILAPTPAEVLADRHSDEAAKDIAAQAAIAFNLHPSLLKLVSHSKTAYDAWTALCSAFENQEVHCRLTLIYKMLGMKRSNYDSLDKYVLDFKEIVFQIHAAGKALDDEIAAVIVLHNLRPEDSNMRRLVEYTCIKPDSQGNLQLNFNSVIQELFREAQKAAAEEPATKTALKVFAKPAGRSRGRGACRGRGGRGAHNSSSDRFEYQFKNQAQCNPHSYPCCRYCKKTNHPAENCWFKNPAKKRKMDCDEQSQDFKELRKDSITKFNPNPEQNPQKNGGQGPEEGWVLNVVQRSGDSSTFSGTSMVKDEST